MNKTVIGAVCVAGLVMVAGMANATVILDETFDYADGTLLENVSGWANFNGDTGEAVVSDGVVELVTAGVNLSYTFGETYAVSAGSTADNTVDELWFRTRAKLPGDADGANLRPGLYSTDFGGSFGQYASTMLQTDTDVVGTLSIYRPFNMDQGIWGLALPAYDESGAEFFDVYGKLSDDGGDLKVEIWFNPADPSDMGIGTAADGSKTVAYADAGDMVIDQYALGSWGLGDDPQIDRVTVATSLSEVIPEPATIGLVAISSCLLMAARRFFAM